jgi:hypothetical protein
MEYMGAVNMDVDAVPVLCVNITTYVVSLFHHTYIFAALFEFVSTNGSEEACADNYIVIGHG